MALKAPLNSFFCTNKPAKHAAFVMLVLWSQPFSPVPALSLAPLPLQHGLSVQHCAAFWNCAKPLSKHSILDWMQAWGVGWWLFKVPDCGCSNTMFEWPMLQSGHYVPAKVFIRKWLGKLNEFCDAFLFHLSQLHTIHVKGFQES